MDYTKYTDEELIKAIEELNEKNHPEGSILRKIVTEVYPNVPFVVGIIGVTSPLAREAARRFRKLKGLS